MIKKPLREGPNKGMDLLRRFDLKFCSYCLKNNYDYKFGVSILKLKFPTGNPWVEVSSLLS